MQYGVTFLITGLVYFNGDFYISTITSWFLNMLNVFYTCWTCWLYLLFTLEEPVRRIIDK